MSKLLGDQAGCFDPQNHLQICQDCKRNLSAIEKPMHRVWNDFKVSVNDVSKMAPGSSKVSCQGYLEKGK